MSWIRTAVSLIGFGFAIVQFFERLRQMSGTSATYFPEAPKYLGLSLIGSGVAALLISIWQYRWTVNYLRCGSFAPIAGLKEGMHSPVIAVAAFLVCVGLFAFSAVLLHLV
jgi:putative membrane protein